GTTTVLTTASDTCGNSTNCSFTVTVNPISSPPIVLTCSSNSIVAATSSNGAVVFFTCTASGGCNPPPYVTANPPSGSTFPVGTTTVLTTASDTCGNSTNCSFTVTVNPANIPVSFTYITSIQGGIILTWQSGTNSWLYLQRSPALAEPNAAWINIWTGA